VTRAKFIALFELTIDLAHDYALETRIRRLLSDHQQAGDQPRTLVMNTETWHRLLWELDGKGYSKGYFWTPQPEGSIADPKQVTSFYRLPILIKDFLPDLEVIVGV
jgi:hypothetical protein